MSQDSLVDLITREVLEVVRRQVGGGGATPVAIQASAPAAALPMAAPFVAPVAAATRSIVLGDTPLVVVCGNPLGKAQAIAQFGELRKRYPRLGVLLSHAAVSLYEDARRPFAGFTLDPKDRDYEGRVGTYSSVVVLNTSVNFIAKIAALIADTPATIVVFNALKAQRPVVMVSDALVGAGFNPAVTSKIRKVVDEVAGYGVQMATGESLHTAMPPSLAMAPRPTKDTDCNSCAWAGHCATLCSDRVAAVTNIGAVRVGSTLGMATPGTPLGRMIDHTLLKPDATESDVRKLCEEARKDSFASVCVNPSWVRLSKKLLAGSRVMVCTVVGFPLGATSSESKGAETHQAVMDGADEIDMVINVGALKSKDDAKVLEDIKAVVRTAQGRTVKVILEVGLLNDEEKRRGCVLSVEAGADFVKTSTGFGPGGATVADITLMREVVGPGVGVKASGGVRDYETAMKMINAGANRIGASASVSIVKGARGEKVAAPAADSGSKAKAY